MPLLGPDGQTLLSEVPPPDAEPVAEEAVAHAPIPCQTAFVVYLLPDGQWQVADDLDIPLVPERKPHGDDFTSACATTMRDVQTREVAALIQQGVQSTVEGVIQTQMAMAAKAREQFEAQGIAKQLEKDRQRRGGR